MITVIKNTVEVPAAHRLDVAKEVVATIGGSLPDSLGDVKILDAVFDPDGAVLFDPEHKAQMDWLTQSDVLCSAFARNFATGKAYFGVLESGESSFWGVEFPVPGYYRRVQGRIDWDIVGNTVDARVFT